MNLGLRLLPVLGRERERERGNRVKILNPVKFIPFNAVE